MFAVYVNKKRRRFEAEASARFQSDDSLGLMRGLHDSEPSMRQARERVKPSFQKGIIYMTPFAFSSKIFARGAFFSCFLCGNQVP